MKNPKIITGPEQIRQSMAGNQRMLMLLSKDTGGDLYIEDVRGRPGGAVPMHMHSLEDELFIIHRGELTFTIGTQVHVVGAGAMVYGPAGVAHGFTFTGTEETHFTTIAIPGRNFEAFAEATSNLDGDSPSGLMKEISARHGITTY